MYLDLLVRKSLITIVPAHETFFHFIALNSKKKLDYDSVRFNYQRYSPISDSALTYIQKDDKIMIWFYDKKYSSTCTIPEGFLQYRYFARGYDKAIIAIAHQTLSVIEDNILYYQAPIDDDLSTDIRLMQKHYHIDQVVQKDAKWYKENKSRITSLPVIEIIRYFIDKKTIIESFKKRAIQLVMPALFLVILMTAAQFAANQYLHNLYSKLSLQKKLTGQKTKDLFSAIMQNNQEVALLERYTNRYQLNNFSFIQKLSALLDKEDIKLYYFEANKRFFTLRFITKSTDAFLSDLATLPEIESFKVIRQVKNRENNMEISLQIILKGTK